MIRIPGKIPIIIHPLFWLLAIFIGWMSTFTLTGTLLAVLVIVVSVLFHEFGHALTAMAFQQTVRIELAAFGGFTYRQGRKLKLWEEFIVVFNGPLAGLSLGVIAWLCVHFLAIENTALLFLMKFTALVNFFWTVINLVPVLPLDGGHLLSIILEGIFGFKGVKIAIVTGLVIAVSISIFFFAIGAFLVGALFLILSFESFRSLRYYKLLKVQDRDSDLQELMKSADAAFQSGDHEKAMTKFEEVRGRSREGILYTMATQEMAEILRDQKRYEEAYQLLAPIRKSLSGETLSLFHFLAYMNRDYSTVTELSNRCYQNKPTHDTALINALASAAIGKEVPAVGWLECAIREGAPSIEEALKKEEFDSIRHSPRFQQFIRSL
ncbi:MAG: Stage IV sporulation protein FB [Chlamydiae bacterium]|nr:Stage IV sporulation protein FB [Chlamydiota bacterium]